MGDSIALYTAWMKAEGREQSAYELMRAEPDSQEARDRWERFSGKARAARAQYLAAVGDRKAPPRLYAV